MPASEQKKLAGIFISYRRSDNPDAVGRIYDRLVSEFGKARVFKDVDSIPLGQDFRGHLNDIIGGCVAVLAIVGPKWTDIRNEAGTRRLEDPDDFVRIELEAALARSVPVVPVLVGHAPMPGTSQLPTSLASLAFRQSIEVRPDPDFHNDATRLVSALRAIIDPDAPTEPAKVALPKKDRSVGWMAAFGIASIAAAGLAVPALQHLRETPPAESRIAVPLPVQEFPVSMALSPDGLQFVYVAKGDPESRLWLRSLSSTNAQPLPGTQGASAPFWSPDGRSIAFFATGSLKRLDIGGGQPQTLAPASGETTGAWGTGGDIIFNPGNSTGIARIAATGGPVVELTKVVPPAVGHRVHSFLPDGNHFIYAAILGKNPGTYLGALDGSPPVRLMAEVGPGAVLPSGWMLLVSLGNSGGTRAPQGPLLAQRLDVRNAKLTGERITIASAVGSVSASATGLVAYRIGQFPGQRQLTWMNRSGSVLANIGDADGSLDSPRIAPDGRRVVVSKVTQGNRDIWLLDGERASRLTFNSADDAYPVWSPDGQRIMFTSNRSGVFVLHEKLATGAGGEESIKTDEEAAFPTGWSPDGQTLLYFAQTPDNNLDIRGLPATGDRKPFAILETPFTEVWARFSPDGRWVAYESNESGRFEIYVRPYRAKSGQWMVSTAGGVHPMWSADGGELFFINPEGVMMAAPIAANGSALVPGTPVKLFDARIWGGGIDNATGRQYDVAADGRFLVNRELVGDENPTVTLIQNWNPDAGR